MKTFGAYLVEKGLINTGDLVSALVEQMKSLPSVCEVVFEKEILDKEKILAVLNTQTEKKTDFRTAAQSLSLWSEDKEGVLQKEIQGRRKTHWSDTC